MKQAGKSILYYIIGFILIGVVGFLFTNGSRYIDEHNNMQKEAKIALEDYTSTGRAFPVGEYVSYEARWVIGPFATETQSSTTNGVKATSGVSSYYYLVLDDATLMAVKVNNAKDLETLEQMSNWLSSVQGFPTNGKTLKLQGDLREMTDQKVLSYYREGALSIFGLPSSDPAVRYLLLDTTAGREGIYLIIFGVIGLIVLAVVLSKKKPQPLPTRPNRYIAPDDPYSDYDDPLN